MLTPQQEFEFYQKQGNWYYAALCKAALAYGKVKIYPNEKWGGLYRGGYGPREKGEPEFITYHSASSSPHWDWIEMEDGSWKWISQCREPSCDGCPLR